MRFLAVTLLLTLSCATLARTDAPPPEETLSSSVTVWNLPIPVAVVGYTDTTAVQVAMEAWNQWLGTEVFKLGISSRQQVIVEAAPFRSARFAGIAVQRIPWQARVTMLVGYHHRADVIAHELGHVLGLDHDHTLPWSVMDGEPSWVLPRLTRADCLALAEIYFLKDPPCAREMR